MSDTVNGVVEAVSRKDIKTKFGMRNKVSVLVNGEWYGAVANKENEEVMAKVKENDIVKVEYTKNGDFKNVDSVEIIAENTPQAVEEIKKTKGEKGAKEVAESVQKLNDKDLRITYNGSLKSAIEFVDMALRNDLLAIPTKKADKLDAVYEYVKEYTNRFVTDTYTAQLKLDDNKEKETTKEREVGE